MDDYRLIKTAFEGIKSAEVKEDRDVECNPILRVKIGNVKMTFYFEVDEYKDEAYFSGLIVEE